MDLIIYDSHEYCARVHCGAGRHENFLHGAASWASQLVFHLHSFDNNNGLARVDVVTNGHQHAYDTARHR